MIAANDNFRQRTLTETVEEWAGSPSGVLYCAAFYALIAYGYWRMFAS